MELKDYIGKYVIISDCRGYYVVMKVKSLENPSINYYEFFTKTQVIVLREFIFDFKRSINSVYYITEPYYACCRNLNSVRVITEEEYNSIVKIYNSYRKNIKNLTNLIKF